MQADPHSGARRRKILVSALLCAAGAALNILFARLFQFDEVLPLYMDTLFTVAVTLSRGLFWGALTGALSNLIYHSLFFQGWPVYLYTLCNIAVALITALFVRLFPGELALGVPPRHGAAPRTVMDRVMVLLMLSFSMCIGMSVMGGLIAALSGIIVPASPNGDGPELFFKLALRRRALNLVLVEVLSRIPVNVIDRLISVFGGCGIALLLGIPRNASLGPASPGRR